MPWHTCSLKDADGITCKFVHLLEVHHACIVVVLTREQGLRKVCWMSVREWVRVGVPAAEAEVKATDASPMVIDNYNLKAKLL